MGPIEHQDSVCGLAERDGKVLLVRNRRRLNGNPALCWDLPGGGVHVGESLPQALRREWREETHLDADVGDLLLVEDGVVRPSPDEPVTWTWRTAYFAVTTEGEPTPDDGVVEAAWMPRGELVALLDAPYHAALRAYLEGAPQRHAHLTWIDRRAPRSARVSDELRALLAMAAAGAVGETERVAAHAVQARQAGADDARLVEVLLQLAPYCGFPRTLSALGAVSSLWSEGAPALEGDIDPAERQAQGRACFDAVYGPTADRVREGLKRLHPLAQAWIESFAYGRVLAREGALSLVERELLAVSVLTAMGALDEALLGHMRAAKRLGACADEIADAVHAAPLRSRDRRELVARDLLERI